MPVEVMKWRTTKADEVDTNTEENVVDLVDPSASSDLEPHVKQAFQKVQEAMFPGGTMHNCDFRDLVEEHGLSHEKCLAKLERLVLRDL